MVLNPDAMELALTWQAITNILVSCIAFMSSYRGSSVKHESRIGKSIKSTTDQDLLLAGFLVFKEKSLFAAK